MRILYLMKTQDSNLGDLLINRLLVELLAEKADRMLFDVTGVSKSYREAVVAGVRNPVVFSTKRGLRYYLKLLMCRRYFDAVIAPPGHAAEADWRHAVPIFFGIYCRLMGVRFMRLGKSFRQTTGASAFLERLLVRLSHHTMVRDRESLKRIRSSRRQTNISCEPDLIVLLSGRGMIPPGYHTGILVSFRFDLYQEERREGFVRQVSGMTAHYAQTMKLPVTVTWQVERDEACARSIAEALKSCDIEVSLSAVTLDNMARTYGSADLVLSNRLHVSLTALTLGANAWAVCDPGKDRKIMDAFVELGLEHRVVDVDYRGDLTASSDSVATIEAARHRLRSAILEILEEPVRWH